MSKEGIGIAYQEYKTASSNKLGKHMILVDHDSKDEVEDFLDGLFEQIPEDKFIKGIFKKPQRGGNTYKKNRVSNIKNYQDKLEERVHADLAMYDEDELSATPPPRPQCMTISYAQATQQLTYNDANPSTSLSLKKTSNTQETMTTSMSMLTQTSLDDAMNKICAKTEKSIKSLREEMKTEVQKMEDKITNAVIAAIQTAPPVESMETECNDTNSPQLSYTAATIQTLLDKYDSLHSAMLMLTKTVTELAKKQDHFQYKHTRPLETPPKFCLPSTIDSPKSTQRSPPTKVPHAEELDCPTTLPPNGTPSTGAQEGQ
jgi:hypothetical protein